MRFDSVVISGLPVSGKSALSRELAAYFNWKLYSVGNLWREQWRELYPNAEVPFEEYWRNTTNEENRRTDERLKEIVSGKGVIADTRYGFICKDIPDVLFPFTFSDIDIRAKRASEKYPSKNLDEIKTILRQREEDEVERGMKLYGEDYRNKKHYHTYLNTGLLSLEQEVDIISALMK